MLAQAKTQLQKEQLLEHNRAMGRRRRFVKGVQIDVERRLMQLRKAVATESKPWRLAIAGGSRFGTQPPNSASACPANLRMNDNGNPPGRK